ncbi:hypothetical protein RND71_032147 [Anisodus tanguticus]|uniref:Uncharacterized protein n=1 Tax=Anisodus tanguticus TaxID=243964 RepID=A0AAE1REM5_9SOLA|nr:hypothetical protein RND71_032147 [Anisodus tanguticus]
MNLFEICKIPSSAPFSLQKPCSSIQLSHRARSGFAATGHLLRRSSIGAQPNSRLSSLLSSPHIKSGRKLVPPPLLLTLKYRRHPPSDPYLKSRGCDQYITNGENNGGGRSEVLQDLHMTRGPMAERPNS